MAVADKYSVIHTTIQVIPKQSFCHLTIGAHRMRFRVRQALRRYCSSNGQMFLTNHWMQTMLSDKIGFVFLETRVGFASGEFADLVHELNQLSAMPSQTLGRFRKSGCT